MEIGVLLHTRQIIRREDAAQSFEKLWSDAAQAEELGFDHLWLGDSVTILEKARGDCLTTMAALAAPHIVWQPKLLPPRSRAPAKTMDRKLLSI
jgi:hypothetical protein